MLINYNHYLMLFLLKAASSKIYIITLPCQNLYKYPVKKLRKGLMPANCHF